MKVEKISATIRYSQDTGKGAWKVIELGAEGTVDARENWQAAQSYLYAELGKQMRQLWSNGNGAALNGNGGTETAVQLPAQPAPVSGSETLPEHWCEEHRAAFTQKNGKGGESWWSHKAGTEWCREGG